MKIHRVLLIAALMLWLPSSVAVQSGAASPSPAAAPTGGVLWYGKAPPGWGGSLSDMKLIAPGVGWATSGGRYYWTTNNGGDWRDITPPISAEERAGGIFFLNSSEGWIVINRLDNPDPGNVRFDLAHTSDAGANWSKTSFTMPFKEFGLSEFVALAKKNEYFSGAGNVAFADPLRGWLSIQTSAGTMNSWKIYVMATLNGGQTWSLLRSAPDLLGKMLMVTAKEG